MEVDRYLSENVEGVGKSRTELWGNPILNGKGGGDEMENL